VNLADAHVITRIHSELTQYFAGKERTLSAHAYYNDVEHKYLLFLLGRVQSAKVTKLTAHAAADALGRIYPDAVLGLDDGGTANL